MKKVDLSSLADSWPSSFVTRSQIEKFSGGMTTSQSMAVFDCKGLGPEGRIIINKKTAYPVESVIRWLESRAMAVG